MITAAVIGVGIMGGHHARVYRQMSDIQLTGLAEIDPGRGRNASDEFGLIPYNDYQKMLQELHPQIVSVAVPASLHEEVTIACLQAGAHVIVEKPMATTLQAAARMIRCARQLGRQLMVGHIERFNPIIQMLKSEIEAQTMGEVHQIVCRRSGPFPERVRDVGVVLDTAIHDLDVMSYLINQAPLSVFAEVHHHLGTEQEDAVLGVLYYENNLRGHLDVNWISPLKTREIFVYAEHGLLHADAMTQSLVFYGRDETVRHLPVPVQDPLKAELQYFLQLIKRETFTLEGSVQDGFFALQLARALLESGRDHEVKQIPDFTEELIEQFMH